ncbi:class I SAM-dependent methyltransferase, partial [Arthrospira platensis SPKY2]
MQIPPESMRFATIENRDPDMYVISGLKVAADFSSILHKHGTSISKVQSILDIGCGVGRVSRVWPLLCNGNIWACDVVKEFIDWCSSNIENVSFFNNNE